jgi:3-oxoadipate enol-lactonase
MPAVKTGFVACGTAKLYYEESGSGSPVIMLHGGSLDCRMWDDQFPVFACHYRTIRYDARGHGCSVSEGGDFSFHDDLCCVMDRLEIKKAAIMGLSMGGYTAVDFTLKYPGRVSTLILASPGLTGYNFKSKEYAVFVGRFRNASEENDIEAAVVCSLETWTDGPFRNPSQVRPAVREKVRDMLMGTMQNGGSENRAWILDPPAINRLNEIAVPTLAIVGDLDMPDIIDIARLIEKNIPGARKVVINGAAHMVNIEKPQEFNDTALDFLSMPCTAQGVSNDKVIFPNHRQKL